MSDHNRWARVRPLLPLLAVLLYPALLLSAFLYSYVPWSPLDGWWVTDAHERDLPHEMSVNVRRGVFKMREWDSDRFAVRSVTLKLDGESHQWSEERGGTVRRTTYQAHLNQQRGLVLTRTVKEDMGVEVVGRDGLPFREICWTEEEIWSRSSDGHLIISRPGQPDVSYKRVPFLTHLFKAEP